MVNRQPANADRADIQSNLIITYHKHEPCGAKKSELPPVFPFWNFVPRMPRTAFSRITGGIAVKIRTGVVGANTEFGVRKCRRTPAQGSHSARCQTTRLLHCGTKGGCGQAMAGRWGCGTSARISGPNLLKGAGRRNAIGDACAGCGEVSGSVRGVRGRSVQFRSLRCRDLGIGTLPPRGPRIIRRARLGVAGRLPTSQYRF